MSPADRDDARLPARAEAMLAEWPLSEKDDADWEERAQAIEARLAEARRDSSAALLRPPFPSAPGDEAPGAQRPSSPRLADIARAVRESKPEHNLTEIAKASLSIASQARASAPELAAKVRAAQARAAGETPVPAPRVEAAAPPPVAQGAGRTPQVLVIVAGLALAAAVALFIGSRKPAPETAASEPQAAPTALASSVAAAPPPPAEVERGVPVEELPPGAAESSKLAARPRSGGKAGAGSPSAKPGQLAAAEKTAPGPAAAAAKPEARDPELKPADGHTSLPEKPSTGAVQAAIGSVIGGARSCVAGQDRASSATIVFGSDGRVKSVMVGGAAAGTPAAGCIKSALEKARVSPFAKSSFSAQVAIRPN